MDPIKPVTPVTPATFPVKKDKKPIGNSARKKPDEVEGESFLDMLDRQVRKNNAKREAAYRKIPAIMESRRNLPEYTPPAIVLTEAMTKIGKFNGFEVMDTRHAIDEFRRHFPSLRYDDFVDIIHDGLIAIRKIHNFERNNYMIISRSTGMRIPVDIRFDYYVPNKIIAAIPTTLAPHEPYDKRNEIRVMVESKVGFEQISICEGFHYFSEDGEIFADFDIIRVR